MQHPQRTSTTSINVSNTAQQAALKPPQQQPQPQGSVHTQHHRPPPTQQLQPQPPPHAASAAQRASAISSAATRAATHASTRSKHAQNLLVDVAELVAEIFPFDIVARQHGTLPRKVSEALAAVVQVPLLRCATDKRRAGKLGSDRMKDFREARRGWLALVREWEREERERERGGEEDAEGEDDDGVVVGGNDDAVRVGAGQGYGNAGDGRGNGRRQSTTKGKGGKQANVDPRAVYPPGEPSALDVALLLPPAEMPDQMLREGFFSGPW
ncbi:hypothetical protein GE09DRAFT_1214044 [Coniochaeta sp. 2T2.1]|nr:hypothetical protein GE09DRAFT_1214044 [Coniochaeta sp. 2T2.1]